MMDKLLLCSLCLLTTVMMCLCEDVAEESLLKTLLNDQSKDNIRDIVDELLLEHDNPTLESLLSNEERQISDEKRIFCNGAVGCMNRMRRTKPEIGIKKRPFCNGFFGCGNGKRSYNVPVIQDEPEKPQQKRLFCNGFFGCRNGKRSYNVPVIQDEPEKKQHKRLFCNITGCGNMGKRTILSALLGRLQPMSEENRVNV